MNVGEWVQTLELGEQSPIPIINHFNNLLGRAKHTNHQLMEMENHELSVPLAGAALGGLHCVAPAQRATEISSIENQPKGNLEMAKQKKSEIRSIPAVSTVGSALLACIDPVISKLDSFVDLRGQTDDNSASGHTLPSRNDLTLRIFLSNLCYNAHTQIHGGPKFPGIKASHDKAANAWASLCQRYETRPEQMEDDPDSDKFFRWYEETGAKLSMLQDVFEQFKDVYRAVTGEAWAPRQAEAAKPVDANRANRMLEAFKARRAMPTEISEDSVLIKAQVA